MQAYVVAVQPWTSILLATFGGALLVFSGKKCLIKSLPLKLLINMQSSVAGFVTGSIYGNGHFLVRC